MPAAGRRCRQPVRHSVGLSGPRRRHRLLSPDARGPPGAARSSRGPARRRAPPPPGPAPALLPVCPSVRPSVHPPARASVLLFGQTSGRLPAPPALSLPGRCLFVSAPRCLSPSFAPHTRVPSPRSSRPSASFPELLHSSGPPQSAPHLWVLFLQNSLHTPRAPPHPLGAFPSICTPGPWGLAS